MQAIASSSRALRLLQPCACARRAASTFVNSTPITWPVVDRIPKQKEPLTTVEAVLKAAGRNMEQYEGKFETWEALFGADGEKMKDMGLPCKDRRYLMRQLQWYRLGFHPADMATKLKPKKKFRGHGDRIQKGVRVPEKYLFRLSHRKSIRRSADPRKRAIKKYSPLRSDRDKKGRIQTQGHSLTYPPTKFTSMLSNLGRRKATSSSVKANP